MQENTTQGFRFTGWHMLFCMFAFFGIIIAVNLTMATLASSSWTGLVVKNTYVASQQYNDHLMQADDQSRRGLKSEISYENGALSFQISGRDSEVLKPEDATLWIGRPAFEQEDRLLALQCSPEGKCETKLALSAGVWAVRIEASLPGGKYRRDARITINQTGGHYVE